MIKSTKNIAGTVRELIQPTANELGYFLWDVEYVKEGARRILRITIDSEEGILIEDCEKFHRAIDPLLDEAHPIEDAYYLEVSSPGIERELKTDEHITVMAGADVELKLYAPLDGVKSFRGTLVGLDGDGKVIITVGENELSFERAAVAKIQTVFEF